MAKRVLVIDDDDVDRMAVRRALKAAGLSGPVVEATSCEDGLRAAQQADIGLVFLDYMLPDGNGLDLLRTLRQKGIEAPIVMLTGQGDESTAVEIMKAGAVDYLPKALATPERLAQCVRNALRVHEAESLAANAERDRERALLHEREARAEALDAQRRLAFLAEASAIIASSLDPKTTMESVARLAVPFLADWCWVDLLLDDGSFERIAVAHRSPEDESLARRLLRSYAPHPEALHGASRVTVTGRSELLSSVPDWLIVSAARDADHLETLRSIGMKSLVVTPLVGRGRILGAMTFVFAGSGRVYDLVDLAFAEEISRRAAQGLDNARLYQAAREAEDRLRRQLEFSTAVTGSLSEGVLAVDAQRRVVFANPAAESLLAQGLVGKPLENILRADEEHDDGARLLDAIADARVTRFDRSAFRGPRGEPLRLALSAAPILEEGAPAGAVLAFHDISERLLADAELEASRRHLAQSEKLSALGTLVSGVAHELRTPLTYLSNNIFLLHRRLEIATREDPGLASLADELARYGASALEGVERINALVKDLRPFAKAEGPRRMQSGLEDLVADAVELYRVTSRGLVSVDARLDPTGPILAEKGQIQRVVINLLVNAGEAMSEGGTIRVTTRAVAGGAEVEVADEGTGIPPEHESRVFDPFFTTKPDGTGLGLAITRRIIEAHEGSIRFATRPGGGTVFTVHLPSIRQVPLENHAASDLAPPAVGSGS